MSFMSHANDSNNVSTNVRPFLNTFNEDGAPPGKAPVGSYWSDVNNGQYRLKWPNMAACLSWMEQEARSQHVDFVKGFSNKQMVRSTQQQFVCSSGRTGGERNYTRKFPDRERNVASRKTDCPVVLSIKTYPDTDTVLGKYTGTHNHPVDEMNLKFVGISSQVRSMLHSMAREHRSKDSMLDAARSGVFSALAPGKGVTLREQLLIPRNVAYYERKASEFLYRFDKTDAGSVHVWVERLEGDGAVLAYKPRSLVPDTSSPFLGLRDDTFLLILQWPWQRELWSEIGPNFMGVDGTHNITMYKNLIFHTIMGRDSHGHGVPLCWMFASNGEEVTYKYFFLTFLRWNPVKPSVILTDKDVAQINALRGIFPDARILLCWWHVLHDWYGKLDVTEHNQAWELLKALPRQTSRDAHKAHWIQLKALLPDHFLDYMEENWMTSTWLSMWAGYHREGRTIIEQQDTNMIVESYHNFFKSHVLKGYRNRRLDYVIYLLPTVVKAHYLTKQLRQRIGMNGLDLFTKARKDADKRGKSIPLDDIQLVASLPEGEDDNSHYQVRSQTDRTLLYLVDPSSPSCSCRSFQAVGIRWCKHLSAVDSLVNKSGGQIWDMGADPVGLGVPAPQSSIETIENLPDARLVTAQHGDSQVRPMSPPTNASAEHVARQVRFLAGSSNLLLSSAPEHLLESLSQAVSALVAHGTQSLPPAEKLPPRRKYATENSLPPKKTTKKSRKTNQDAFSGGEKSGKHAKKGKTTVRRAQVLLAAVSSLQSARPPNVAKPQSKSIAPRYSPRAPQIMTQYQTLDYVGLPYPPASLPFHHQHSTGNVSSHQPNGHTNAPPHQMQLRHTDSWSSFDSQWSLPSHTSSSSYSTESLASTYSTQPPLPNYHDYNVASTNSLSSHASFYGAHPNTTAGPSQRRPTVAGQPHPIEDMPESNFGYCVLDDYAAVDDFFGF